MAFKVNPLLSLFVLLALSTTFWAQGVTANGNDEDEECNKKPQLWWGQCQKNEDTQCTRPGASDDKNEKRCQDEKYCCWGKCPDNKKCGKPCYDDCSRCQDEYYCYYDCPANYECDEPCDWDHSKCKSEKFHEKKDQEKKHD